MSYISPNHEAWQTRDYSGRGGGRGLNLTKSRLGEFIYLLLKANGIIISSYCMNSEFDRAYVQFIVSLPKGTKDSFVKETGFILDPISTFSVS